MGEVWVTMASCSECFRRHDPDAIGQDECDHWCHDGDTDLEDGDDG